MNKKTIMALTVAALSCFAMARPGPGGFCGPRGGFHHGGFHHGGPGFHHGGFHGGPRFHHGGYHHHHGWGWGLGAAELDAVGAAVHGGICDCGREAILKRAGYRHQQLAHLGTSNRKLWGLNAPMRQILKMTSIFDAQKAGAHGRWRENGRFAPWHGICSCTSHSARAHRIEKGTS